jgi:hypothetical protein
MRPFGNWLRLPALSFAEGLIVYLYINYLYYGARIDKLFIYNLLAEGEGFEPPVGLPLGLISSQVPSTAQPPFRRQWT